MYSSSILCNLFHILKCGNFYCGTVRLLGLRVNMCDFFVFNKVDFMHEFVAVGWCTRSDIQNCDISFCSLFHNGKAHAFDSFCPCCNGFFIRAFFCIRSKVNLLGSIRQRKHVVVVFHQYYGFAVNIFFHGSDCVCIIFASLFAFCRVTVRIIKHA